MNNTKLQKQVDALNNLYPPSYIQRMFVHRLDDKLFAEIGKLAIPTKKLSEVEPHEIVWTGYEAVRGYSVSE